MSKAAPLATPGSFPPGSMLPIISTVVQGTSFVGLGAILYRKSRGQLYALVSSGAEI